MLTRFDDYPVHQTTDTLDHVADGDPRFLERALFIVHGRDDAFLLETGFGLYPNINMIYGWTCGETGDLEYNLRAARPLDHDRSNLSIAPFHFEVITPMEEWRIRADENEHGISFDLVFRLRMPPYEFDPVFIRKNNYVEHHQMHLMQSGTFDGWVKIGDKRFEGGFIGSRDRSWGVRGPHANQAFNIKGHSAVDVFESEADRREPNKSNLVWLAAEFPDYALHGWFVDDKKGKALIADGCIVDAKDGALRVRFDGWEESTVTQGTDGHPESATMRFVAEDGGIATVVARPLLGRSPRGNGYYKGFFAQQHPALHVEGEVWNTADPEFRKEHGYMNGSMLAEFEHDGNVGYGLYITTMLERRS